MEQRNEDDQGPATCEPEEGEPAHAGGADAERPFSLLQELPGPLMRQLVQRHLDGASLLALLRTSHSLARAAVQHHTHQQRRALAWTWDARKDADSSGASVLDAAQAATTASLLERWAPAELHAVLRGPADGSGALDFALLSAALPLLTRLHLLKMHLPMAARASLRHCQRLRALHVDRCFACDAQAWPRRRAPPPLPLLRAFRCLPPLGSGDDSGPMRDLCTLCALAAEVSSGAWVRGWAHRFTSATRWVVEGQAVDSEGLRDLLALPGLRHVRAPTILPEQDHSQQACQWETLTVEWLDGTHALPRLPSAIGRVVVEQALRCLDAEEQHVAAVLRRWGPDRLHLRADMPPKEDKVQSWHLSAEERRSGFFTLIAAEIGAVAAHAPLLRRVLLAPGGGPHTLEVGVRYVATPLELSLLAGTGVRTVCLSLGWEVGVWGGLLGSALPACVACVRLVVNMEEQAVELVSGEAAGRPLRAVLITRFDDDEERRVRELCAAHQPLVQLDVVRCD